MAQAPAAPRTERRRYPRINPPNLKVWLVSGEFEELYTTVNFCRRLYNLSMGGICVETTGRLRPDVKMCVEVRFDDLHSSLKSEAKIVWVHTATQGATEVHKAGLKFVGTPEITKPVREFLMGGRATMIRERRQAEYHILKQKSESRIIAQKKSGFLKKAIITLAILALVYVGSFWTFLLLGRTGTQDAGMRFRYLGEGSKGGTEVILSKVYAPLVWTFGKAGINLVYDSEPSP
jgi:hypothetical protein